MKKVRDPVCGMLVDVESAPAEQDYRGETYYFCSIECRNQFNEAPWRYVEVAEPTFTKAMGIPAPKFGFAGSGGAEYEAPSLDDKTRRSQKRSKT
jgi:YHS domain-containing protein